MRPLRPLLSILLPLVSLLASWPGHASAADVILNEYNGVGDSRLLEDGSSDVFWGRRPGNGGDWFELVVIADHLDMRGWEIVVSNSTGDPLNQETFSLELTRDPVWADLRSGTIITISERLGNNVDDYEPAVGRWWINVRASPDTSGAFVTVECLAPACNPANVNWKVSNTNWQATVKDPLGSVVFGPAGEGIMPPSGVGSMEVAKLEADPSDQVVPLSNYQDGSTSTFGQPNSFNGGVNTQDFDALRDVVPYEPLAAVRVNEVFTHSDPGVDWVELHNTSGGLVNIGGWFLSDRFSELTRYRIPDGTQIVAGGFVVFDEVELGFAFSSACGDSIILSAGDGVSPTGPRDFAEFGAVENGVSFGRPAERPEAFTRLTLATRGAANGAALIGPVVVNEIMYNPPDPGLAFTVSGEFVELHNTSASPVDLFISFGLDGTFPWRMRGGVDFDFDTTTTIAGGGFLLVTDFDPVARPDLLAEFRTLYALDASVPIVGPYAGGLNNFSDLVRLDKPDTPEPSNPCGSSPGPYVPYAPLESIEYFDFGEWPAGADGNGPSLERIDPMGPGDAPSNWQANATEGPTPGRANSSRGTTTTTLPTGDCTVNADCNDGNPCTEDHCMATECMSDPTPLEGLPCDDDEFCNGDDTCNAGFCSVHSGDPCTGGQQCADLCNEAADICDAPAGTDCDDGMACSLDDQCDAGQCVGSPPCDADCDRCAGPQCRPACGVPSTMGDEPTAVDALFMVRAAVQLVACLPCLCDVDQTGVVTVADALRTLQRAIGIDIELNCPR